MKASHVWLLAWLVLFAHCYFAWAGWQMLPERGAAAPRIANAALPATLWFGIAGSSAFIFLLIRLLCSPAAVVGWNIPEKERFLKLSPEKQAPVAEIIVAFGALSAICIMLVFCALQAGMLSMAINSTRTLPWWTLVAVAVLSVFLLLALIPWSRAVTTAIERAERL